MRGGNGNQESEFQIEPIALFKNRTQPAPGKSEQNETHAQKQKRSWKRHGIWPCVPPERDQKDHEVDEMLNPSTTERKKNFAPEEELRLSGGRK
jgi:hypothetical protein